MQTNIHRQRNRKNFSTRIKEHLNPKKDSAIQTHLQENPTHVFDPENIEILDKATSNFKIRLKEKLHIDPDFETNCLDSFFYKIIKNILKKSIYLLYMIDYLIIKQLLNS